jgi:hypothetical protein
MVPGLRWASWWAELPASPAVELGLRRTVGSRSFGPAPTALCQRVGHRSKSLNGTSKTKTAALDPPPKKLWWGNAHRQCSLWGRGAIGTS